jgi:hypothetical protein
VIFDAAGNVVGGGNGYSFGSLPPGTRVVFKLTGGGFSDIPLGNLGDGLDHPDLEGLAQAKSSAGGL